MRLILTAIVSGTVVYSAGTYIFKNASGEVLESCSEAELKEILEGIDDIDISAIKGSALEEAIEGSTGNLDDALKGGVRKGSSHTTAYHTVDDAGKAQSVLDGIDISYTSSESRFGQGFYVSAEGETTVAELAAHGADAKYSIRYDMNLNGQKVLDLTNPSVAADWGYIQNQSSILECQKIADRALEEGYNVIKVQSYRCEGTNYIIYDNFEEILSAQMVTPVKP